MPTSRSYVPAMVPPLTRTRPPVRIGRRIAGLTIVVLLFWGGLMALYWVRAAHGQWTGLQWAGQILFTLLVAILLTAIIGSLWGIEDWS